MRVYRFCSANDMDMDMHMHNMYMWVCVKGGATLASPRPGHGQEPHGIQSASTGPVPWVSNLHPTLPPSPRHSPHTTPTAWTSTCSETPSREARVKG